MSTSKVSSETMAKNEKANEKRLEELKSILAERGWQLTEGVTSEGNIKIIAKKAS